MNTPKLINSVRFKLAAVGVMLAAVLCIALFATAFITDNDGLIRVSGINLIIRALSRIFENVQADTGYMYNSIIALTAYALMADAVVLFAHIAVIAVKLVRNKPIGVLWGLLIMSLINIVILTLAFFCTVAPENETAITLTNGIPYTVGVGMTLTSLLPLAVFFAALIMDKGFRNLLNELEK